MVFILIFWHINTVKYLNCLLVRRGLFINLFLVLAFDSSSMVEKNRRIFTPIRNYFINRFMREKIVGYVLLSFSVLAIIGTTLNVYLVFIGKAKPIDIFGSLGSFDLAPGLVPDSAGQGDNNLLASFNIFAHLALMVFMISAAFKIGRLGVMMVRPIKVNLNQKK